MDIFCMHAEVPMVRVTLNLPDDLMDRIKATAVLESRTVTDVFRRSLEMNLFLNAEEAKGAKLILEKRGGRMVEILRQR